MPRNCTLCWGNSLPTGLGELRSLCKSWETEKAKGTSEDRGMKGIHRSQESEKAWGVMITLNEDQDWVCIAEGYN